MVEYSERAIDALRMRKADASTSTYASQDELSGQIQEAEEKYKVICRPSYYSLAPMPPSLFLTFASTGQAGALLVLTWPPAHLPSLVSLDLTTRSYAT